MDNRPIGVLDSGIGGLTIWQAIVKELPQESIDYIADSKNCPYGNKSPDVIYSLAKRLVEFLLKKDVKLIVIACNTITVTALDKLRSDFPHTPMVGIVPVIKTAAEKTRNGKIGILSTSGTAKSQYQKELIEKFAKEKHVVNIGTDELVPLIEQGGNVNEVLSKVLLPFKRESIDTLALGCSHFPFIRKEIQKVLGSKVQIFDSASAIARQISRVLTARESLTSLKKPSYTFYTTGELDRFDKIVNTVIQSNVMPDLIRHLVL